MANRWGNNGNSDRLFFLSSKITENGDCSHEIKRHLLLGRKAMTNLDSVLKSRNITLPTKICIVKTMFFFSSSHVQMPELDNKKGCSAQFSCSVVSDSLRPHESQHTRPPCPSPTPGVHSNSRSSGQ